MSLNKFTDLTRKDYMNINCSELKCENLTVDNPPWGSYIKVGETAVSIGAISGFTIDSQTPAFYKIIGDFIDISGSFRGQNSAGSVTFIIQIPSIDGKSFTIGKHYPSSINGVDFQGNKFVSTDAYSNQANEVSFSTSFDATGNTSELNYNFTAKYT